MRKKLVFNEKEWRHYCEFNDWPTMMIPDVFPCLVLWNKESREYGRHGFWMVIFLSDLQDDQTDDSGMSISGN